MRAAVLGYGSAGTRHAGLLVNRGVTVVVSDPSESRKQAALEAGLAVGDAADALMDAEIAVIASPNHLHREQLDAALAAGCDVFVEKPIAIDSHGIDLVLAEARAAGHVIGVGNNLRFVEAIERAREVLANEQLGQVIRARADFGYDLRAWRPGRDLHETYSARADQGGGILLDAIHEFDYLYWLFGEVARVCCFAGSRSSLGLEVEDVACAVLDFKSGVMAEVALDYASGVYTRGFEVVGEEATATWRWGDPTLVIRRESATESIAVGPVTDMYERLIDDFLAAVAERRDPRTPAEDGLAVLNVVEAAIYAWHGEVVATVGKRGL